MIEGLKMYLFDSADDGILTVEYFINFYKKVLLNSYEIDFTRKIKGFYNLCYRKIFVITMR
jgi:hypothetical protein